MPDDIRASIVSALALFPGQAAPAHAAAHAPYAQTRAVPHDALSLLACAHILLACVVFLARGSGASFLFQLHAVLPRPCCDVPHRLAQAHV